MDSMYVDIPFLHSRRFEDPFNPSIVSYLLYVDTSDLPDFPNEPNARPSDYRENAPVYKAVRASALDEDVTPAMFGYKHLGINLIARRLHPISEKVARVYFGEDDGCINGGHGVRILRETQETVGRENMPPNFVKVFVTTGLPHEVIPEIAGANNASIQVKAESLLDLADKFDPIKEAMQKSPIGVNGVAWREGEKGLPVVDLLAMMNCFRAADLGGNPIDSYYAKSRVVDAFREKPDSFYAVAPLLPDLCKLMDAIRVDGQAPYNQRASGNFGLLRFVQKKEKKSKGQVTVIENGVILEFTGKTATHALSYAAAYPIFAAFRLLVKYDEDAKRYYWAEGGLQRALEIFRDNAPDLITTIKRAEHKTVMMLGRDPGIWESIYNKIDNVILREQLAKTT
jgi:hypothetical protein